MNSTKTKDAILKLALVACIAIATLCLSPRLVGLLGNSSAIANVPDQLSLVDLPLQPQLVTKPIEEIRCGDRIPSELPPGLLPEDEPEPNQETWRLVELEVDKSDGSKVEVNLIRPLEWLQQAGAIQNGRFQVSVEELDIEGEAAVLNVLPCPQIEPGEGKVVTGTFKHTSRALVEIHIKGESKPLVCTSGHPIWVESRKEFSEAIDIQTGDLLLTPNGRRVVSTVRSILDPDSIGSAYVHNIEVSSTHTYHVGNVGILVHNAVIGDCTAIGRGDDTKDVDDNVDTWWKSGRIPGPHDDPVTLKENKAWLKERFEAGHKFILKTNPNQLDDHYGGKGNPNGFFTYMELRWLRMWGAEIIEDFGD